MAHRFYGDVFVSKTEDYDKEKIKNSMTAAFSALGIVLSEYVSKKVVIKPNLVMKKAPDSAATTHPAVLEVLIELLNEAGIRPVIAESPGGVYSAARLASIYRTCGIEEVAKRHDCELNFDVSFSKLSFDGGKTSKVFDIITPIIEADVIFDLCKLKSHSLTKMSGAVKNFFGTVPGVVKFEMHAAYPELSSFASMICDLCAMLCEKKTVIALTDGIVGMEGDGPTGGVPRKIGALLVSKSPFCSDVVSAEILGVGGDTPIISEALDRGYMPGLDGINVLGDGIDALKLSDFVLPKSHSNSALNIFSQGTIGKFFMPGPRVTKKCRACGECVASCPQHTITIKSGRAKINSKNCIRCYCCQELCPFVAIETRRNPIINIINKIK